MKAKMSHWNYRIVQDEHGILYIHEVYYDKSDKIVAWTQSPVTVLGESKKDVKYSLKKIKEALKKPILKEENKKLIEIKQ